MNWIIPTFPFICAGAMLYKQWKDYQRENQNDQRVITLYKKDLQELNCKILEGKPVSWEEFQKPSKRLEMLSSQSIDFIKQSEKDYQATLALEHQVKGSHS
jgi:hypothetical protein